MKIQRKTLQNIRKILIVLALLAMGVIVVWKWKDGWFVFSTIGLGIPALMMVLELLRVIQYYFADEYHTGGQAVRHWICIFALLIMVFSYVGLILKEWFSVGLVWAMAILLFVLHQRENAIERE